MFYISDNLPAVLYCNITDDSPVVLNNTHDSPVVLNNTHDFNWSSNITDDCNWFSNITDDFNWSSNITDDWNGYSNITDDWNGFSNITDDCNMDILTLPMIATDPRTSLMICRQYIKYWVITVDWPLSPKLVYFITVLCNNWQFVNYLLISHMTAVVILNSTCTTAAVVYLIKLQQMVFIYFTK